MMAFCFQFKKPVIIQVSGKDATRYLHARLTNDIQSLGNNQACSAACLSPQGKTEGYFEVYKQDDENYLLISFGGEAENILTGLTRFIVADRVEAKVRIGSQLAVISNLSTDSRMQTAGSEHLLIPTKRYNFPAFFLLSNENSTTCPQISENDFTLMRIKNNAPEFPFEIKPDSLFAESTCMHAISFTKGCYAGQEVIEKITSHGKLPAKIMAFKCTAKLDSDSQLTDQAGQKAGEILNIAKDSEFSYLFAKVKQKFFGSKLTANSEELLPLF